MLRMFSELRLVMALASLAAFPASAQTPRRASPRQPAPAIFFERSEGRAGKSAAFISRGAGHTLFVTPQEAVFRIKKRTVGRSLLTYSPEKRARADGAVARMQLLGADSAAQPLSAQPLPSVSNYFVGSDRTKWRVNTPNYATAGFSNVYKGIDVAYYGNEGRLEYDFIVRPSAKPSQIKLRFAGAKSVQALPNGDLRLDAEGGALRWRAPIAYQDVKGTRTRVPARYHIQNGNEVCFRVGAYDPSKPLVIDPKLIYSTYLGGGNQDATFGIATDSAGSVYVTGTTYSADFPTTAGGFQTASAGGSDVFVAKFSPDGKTLLYSSYIGGSANESGAAIATDSAGNVYVAGQTYSSNFPTTPNAYQASLQGRADAFLAQISADGKSLLYSSYVGGALDDNATSLALDSANSLYLGGWTASIDFPVTAGAFQTTHNKGVYDGFVMKFGALGSPPAYSTYFGASGSDQINGVAVDSQGAAYITGVTTSPNFPVSAGAFRSVFSGYPSAFAAKLNSNGKSIVYSTYLTATGWVLGYGIAVDKTGSAYITGATYANNYPVSPGAYQTTVKGRFDAFVTKLQPNGNKLSYSTYIGGAGDDIASSIALDSAGNAYITGQTYSADFPTSENSFQTQNAGGVDSFIIQLDGAGKTLLYSTYAGGAGDDSARSIAVNSSGKAYITGYTTSANFPVTGGAYQSSNLSFAGTAFITGEPGAKDVDAIASPVTGAIGRTATFSATLLRSRNSAPLAKKSLTFSIDGTRVGAALTDDAGKASLSYVLDENTGAGSHDLAIAFEGDAASDPAAATTSLTISPSDATIAMNDATGGAGDVLQLAAALTRNTDGLPVVNRLISFSLDGSSIGSALTDASGVATLAYPIAEALSAGAHAVTLSFAGERDYNPASGAAKLVIGKTDTTLNASDVEGTQGKEVKLAATLSRNNDNAPLEGRTAVFSLDGSPVGSGVSDATGSATLVYKIPKNMKGGGHALAVKFAGDKSYAPSAASNNLNVNIDTLILTTPLSTNYGRTLTLTGVLKEALSQNGVAGQTLVFKVDGTAIGSATTNSVGKAILSYKAEDGLAQGEHALSIEFAGSPPYNPATASVVLAIGKTDTFITLADVSGLYGKTLSFSARLRRITDKQGVANQTIIFKIDGAEAGKATTDADGRTLLSYALRDNITVGSHALTAEFAGTAQYNSSTSGATLVVNRTDSSVTVLARSGAYGKTVSFTGTLKRATDGAKLANQTLSFSIDGAAIGQTVTDAKGNATLVYAIPESLSLGSHTLAVQFAGTAQYAPSASSAPFTVSKADTFIIMADVSGFYGKTIGFSARLRRNTDETGLPNQTITFRLDGAVIGTAVTNSQGRADFSVKPEESLSPGAHALRADFAGSALYNASKGTAVLTVNQTPTYIAVASLSGKRGATVNLVAKLKRSTDSKGAAGRSVAFAVDGVAVGTATTDSAGVATLAYVIPANAALGAHALEGSFAGDAYYAPATSSGATLTVK